MNREHPIAGCATLCVVVAVLWLSGCSVAVAPGYTVVKETRTIQFVPGPPGELRIGLHYELKNTGTTALPFVDISFPATQTFGMHGQHVEWGGHAIELHELPQEYRPEHPDTRRIELEPHWARGRTGSLDIDYAFSSPHDPGAHLSIGPQSFHLSSLGWAALPQPPQHFLSPYPARPANMSYSVRVPAGFLVLARGKLRRRKAAHNEVVYQFQLRKSDLAPFVVTGRYVETRLARGAVVFWTLHPLAESAGSAPQRIANAWTTLEKDFGPIDTEARSPHIVEAPTLGMTTDDTGDASVPFPGGVLVNEQTLALGISSDAFVERVSHALAHNWFSDEMYPSPDAELGISEGLAEYATIVIDEAGGGPAARQARVASFLSRYNEAREHAKEKPLGVTIPTDPPAQRAIALAKAPLMYIALENTCGERPVRNSLKDLVTLLRGQEVGFDDLRSAMEQSCGKNLGEFFRQWLYGNGLPSSFTAPAESAKTP